MPTIADHLETELQKWVNLRAMQRPYAWPTWVSALQEKIKLWLDGEEFEFLEFSGDNWLFAVEGVARDRRLVRG